jgi:predicted dehydrogenase
MSQKKITEEKKTATESSSRRDFLTASGALALGVGMAGSAHARRRRSALKIKPMKAASYSRIIGANDRINIGVIGTGGMGGGHVRQISSSKKKYDDRTKTFGELCNAKVVAVSDVYEPRLKKNQEACGGKAYPNYRDLLTSGEVDAVIIASPEHWHAQMALDAERCGMDVYLQKPMTLTYEGAKKVYKAFKKSDRVFQLGSQYCQMPSWWDAKKLYQSGDLGKIVLSQTSYHRNSRGGEWNYKIDKNAAPGVNLDWNSWLGPLPKMEYNPEYYFRWRKFKEFSSGIISDLLPHKMHSICYVMGADKLPKSVNCHGGIYVQKDRTVADMVTVSVDYGDELMLVTGSTCNEVGLDNMIRGNKATLYIGNNSVKVTPERPYADDMDPINSKCAPAPMGSTPYHLKEFLECMRTRNKPVWDVESSYNVMTAIAMAAKSYYEGRAIRFDAKKERIY